MNTIYGFILIDTPSKKKAHGPRKHGDERYSQLYERWVNASDTGCTAFSLDNEDIYRRPIQVGENYQLVPEGQQINGGDEYTMDGEVWHPIHISMARYRASCCPEGFSVTPLTPILAIRRLKVAKEDKKPEVWYVIDPNKDPIKSQEEAEAYAKELSEKNNKKYMVVRGFSTFESKVKTEVIKTNL